MGSGRGSGSLLDLFWKGLGRSWAPFGCSWAVSWAFFDISWPSLGSLGCFLGDFGASGRGLCFAQKFIDASL